MQLLNFVQLLSGSYSFLWVESGAFLIKLYILGFMFLQRRRIPAQWLLTPWLLFVTTVSCSAFIDLQWIIKLLSVTYIPTLDYHFVLLIIRLAWAAYVMQRLLTILFLKYMTDRDYRLTTQDKLLILISSVVALYFIILAFTDFDISTAETRAAYMLTDPLEAKITNYCVYFCDVITIIYTLRIINSSSFAKLPRILRMQTSTFVRYFIVPYAISTTLAKLEVFFNLDLLISQILGQGPYTIRIFSHLLITASLVYCVRKLMGLRFLGIGLRGHEPSERER